jgi:hypothetical protein
MQIGRETILRRWNGIEQHQRADLSATTDAVGDYCMGISSRDIRPGAPSVNAKSILSAN